MKHALDYICGFSALLNTMRLVEMRIYKTLVTEQWGRDECYIIINIPPWKIKWKLIYGHTYTTLTLLYPLFAISYNLVTTHIYPQKLLFCNFVTRAVKNIIFTPSSWLNDTYTYNPTNVNEWKTFTVCACISSPFPLALVM